VKYKFQVAMPERGAMNSRCNPVQATTVPLISSE
jgi:hypothetical protein